MDDFAPVAATPKDLTPDMRAVQEQSKVVASPQFQGIVANVASWKSFSRQFNKIETDEQNAYAIEQFEAAKQTIKYIEDLRHEIVDFPTKYAKLVNDMFRPLKNDMEGAKQHLSAMISSWDAQKRKEIEAALKAQQKEQEAQASTNDSSLAVVDGDQAESSPVEATPSNVIKTESGSKAIMRDHLEMKIADPTALLKAIASNSKRNERFTLDLISFNEPAIRKLCVGRVKIPGVEWKVVKKAV